MCVGFYMMRRRPYLEVHGFLFFILLRKMQEYVQYMHGVNSPDTYCCLRVKIKNMKCRVYIKLL